MMLSGKEKVEKISLSLRGKISVKIDFFPGRENLEKNRLFPWDGKNYIYYVYIFVPFPHGHWGKESVGVEGSPTQLPSPDSDESKKTIVVVNMRCEKL